MRPTLTALALLALAAGTAHAQPDADLQHSVDELRTSIGRWAVTTECLTPDGSVARAVEGTYTFAWVVPDRVVSGVTEIPALEQTSGILFYIRETERVIEMVSVGADGTLWVMTGPLGGDVRTSAPFETADGGEGRLRFTRSHVTPDAFESRMELSTDGGATWAPGNHQVFRRAQE